MSKMKKFIKSYWKLLSFFAVVGLVGGFFVGLYGVDSYGPEFEQEMLDAGLTRNTVGLISAVQSAAYGLVLGAIGIFFAKKVGLWRDKLSFERKPIIVTAAVSLIGGLALILPDIFFFGKYSEAIMQSYATKPTVPYLIATVTYGGVIEEVMLRLFLMSLVAFVLHKIFERGKDKTSVWVLATANVTCALLFAAGHLPATEMLLGLTPMIVVRCFLLNGAFGALFGWLYRKYGLQYAILAHGGCHVVSKIIWIAFL